MVSAAARPAALAPGVVHVFTDGACQGNPGLAGCAAVLYYNGRVKEFSRALGRATNTIAELSAILHALELIKNRAVPVKVYTDSAYVLGVLSNPRWKPRENLDLIARIKARAAQFSSIEFVKVPGHRSVRYNNRADQLARAAVRAG